MGNGQYVSIYTISDLSCCMSAFFRTEIWKNESTDKWVLSVKEVGCRFFDDFSFNDNLVELGPIEYSQPLGCWNKDAEKIELPSRLSARGSKVCIQNKDYQILKKALSSFWPNSCNDFFIYSDIKIINDGFVRKSIVL